MIGSILVSVLIIGSAILSIAAAAGLLRFPDLLSRLHSASKPQVLGLVLVLIAMAVTNPSFGLITTCLLIAAFQVGTGPVGAHMVGRAGYRTRHLRRAQLYRDELADAVSRAEAREATARAEATSEIPRVDEAPAGSESDVAEEPDAGGGDPHGPESLAEAAEDEAQEEQKAEDDDA